VNDYEIYKYLADGIETIWSKIVDVLGPHIIKMWFLLILIIALLVILENS